MKYLILLVAFTALVDKSAKSQTKQETIKWLTDKINQYGKDVEFRNEFAQQHEAWHQFSLEVENNKIKRTYCYQLNSINNRCAIKATTTVDFNNITNVKINHSNYNSTVFITIYGKNMTNDYDDVKSLNIILGDGDYEASWDQEPDLLNRMFSAFQKLVSYNHPKEVF